MFYHPWRIPRIPRGKANGSVKVKVEQRLGPANRGSQQGYRNFGNGIIIDS